MAFPPQFLEELRSRLPIGGVIGRKVRLMRRGREQVGLCPFHSEKTPSFTVSEEKGFFHCFGCGAHGDVVGFVMRSEGLSFPEAIERLAAEAGLAVPQSSPEERREAERRATLLGALEAAAAWFEARLADAGGRAARAYLAGRGLAEATVARFRLGWAPDSRAALKPALEKAGFPESLLAEAGLVIQPEGGGASFDRFRGRIMFPITDRRGRVIAFGGRLIGEGEPKYLNSPETPLFHKGRVLYGLAQAMAAARAAGEVVVAEGYMDVIALSQAGLAQAVAPLGTALTEEQILELWRLAPEPVLCFDGDPAGQRAAARAAERALPLLKPGQSLRFALLPPGEDPDSLVRREGADAVRALLAQARPLIDLLWQSEAAGRPLDTPERRAGLRQRLREQAARIADRTVQEDYRAEIDRRLEAAFGPPRPGRRRPPPALGGEAARLGTGHLARLQQEILLAVLLNHPVLLQGHAEELAQLTLGAGELDMLRQAIIDHAACHPDLDAVSLRDHLTRKGLGRILETLLARTRGTGFARPEATAEQAEEGLRHVLGLMRERDARRETEVAARELAESMTGEALARFEARQRLMHEGESRRRDLDRDPPFPDGAAKEKKRSR